MLTYYDKEINLFNDKNLRVSSVVSVDDLLRANRKNIKNRVIKSSFTVAALGAVVVNLVVDDVDENIVYESNIVNEDNLKENTSDVVRKVMKADVKVLSAVHKSSDKEVSVDGNKIHYVVNEGEEVFSPIEGIVKSITEDKVEILNEESGLETVLDGVSFKNLKEGSEVFVGDVVGNVKGKNLTVKANLTVEDTSIEVDLKENTDFSNNFNYNDSIMASKGDVKLVLEDEIVVDDEIKSSKVLKGVEIENVQQASLLESSNIYYSEYKLPLSILEGGKANVSENVRNLESLVREVLREKNMENYTEAFLAILQKESGGMPHIVNGDVAQSSQSKSGKIGSITNVRESIEAGVNAFVRALEATNMFGSLEDSGDVRYAIQSYNFGNALGKSSVEDDISYNVSYVQEKAKEYKESSESKGIELMKLKNDWRGDYKYGDFTYVAKYFNIFTPDNVDEKLEEVINRDMDVYDLSQHIVIVEEELEKEIIEGSNDIADVTVEDIVEDIVDVTVEEIASEVANVIEETENTKTGDKYDVLYHSENEEIKRLLNSANFSKYFKRNVLTYKKEIENVSVDYKELTVKTPTAADALVGVKIFLDAGHGGKSNQSYYCTRTGVNKSGDSGAVAGNSMREADINLDMYKEVKRVLLSMGAEVFSSREDDRFVCLEDRLAMAKNNDVDMFISLHNNSNDFVKAQGSEVLYREGDSKSLDLARLVEKYSLHQGLYTMKQRPLQARDAVSENGLHIMRGNIPTVLIEGGFVNNPYDLAVITNENAVKSLANGVGVAVAEYVGKNAYNSDLEVVEDEGTEVEGIEEDVSEEVLETPEGSENEDLGEVEAEIEVEVVDEKDSEKEEDVEVVEDENLEENEEILNVDEKDDSKGSIIESFKSFFD